MNWWLIILAIVGFILTFVVAVYLVVLYCSEDDANQAYVPKVIVVIGLALSAFTVLLLPFDVANKRDPTAMAGSTGGIDLVLMWNLVLWTIAVWVLVVTPFATFYYEAWDPQQKSNLEQIRPALGYTFATIFVFTLFFVILWFTVGYADLDLTSYTSPPTNIDLNPVTGGPIPSLNYDCYCSDDPQYCATGPTTPPPTNKCAQKGDTLSIRVSAFVYVIGLLCFVGWVSFMVFGGVGLIALPMDLINDFRERPEKLSRKDYELRKRELGKEVCNLFSLTNHIKLDEKKKTSNITHTDHILTAKGKNSRG